MERDTRPWASLSRRSRRGLAALALALFGCSSAAIVYSTQEPQAVPRPAPLASLPRAASSAPQASFVDLDGFTPFSAEERFRLVGEALEAEDPARAARELEAIVATETPRQNATLELWLGRLWERAGDSNKALAACTRALVPDALLLEHAELCVARAELTLGKTAAAFARLDRQSFSAGAEPSRRLLLARAAKSAADPELSIRALRSALPAEATGWDTSASELALDLAERLLASPPSAQGRLSEALELTRRASAMVTRTAELTERAELIERRVLAALPEAERTRRAAPTLDERLLRLQTLVTARDNELAVAEANALLAAVPRAERFGESSCEARLLLAKALSGLRRYGEVVDGLADARAHCEIPEQAARVWFVSGRNAGYDGRSTAAIGFFAEVERRFPTNSLADDSRYHAALAYLELGVEARFTELMSSLPEVYPEGDMVADGVFRLALRRIERSRWGEAATLLERAVARLTDKDRGRGLDIAGRERYFRARAALVLGEREAALGELENVVREFPLGYYMVQAHSWLSQLDAARAARAIETARTQAESAPFRVATRRELAGPGFERMLELLRIGELDAALGELDALGLRSESVASEVLWGVALLYERAGFSRFSAGLAKHRLAEVAGRWPAGAWAQAWRVAFPRPYLPIVEREASANGVDPALVYAVMREESAFDPDAVSHADAHGLMQLIVPTARLFAKRAGLPSTPSALKRPSVNVALGCRALASFAGSFEQNPLLAVPAYNAGPGRARRWLADRPTEDFDLWIELIPFHETRRYVKRVLSSRAAYAFLYDPDGARSRAVLPLKVGGTSP